MQTEILTAEHPTALQHAADVLKNGGIVAFPTDTVYGLGVLPLSNETLESLYILKSRNPEKAIAMLVSHFSELERVTLTPGDLAMRLAEVYWPGPLTLVVQRNPALPRALAPDNTIGVRVPNHPVALGLLRLTGPLAVTSANLSGRENTTSAAAVIDQLNGRFHLILDGGETPGGVPSTVVDCTGPEPVVLREGPISQKAIQSVLSHT